MNTRRTITTILFATIAAFGLIGPATAGAAGTINGSVIYATDYRGDLYTVNPDGTNHTRITPTDEYEEEPQYSPDGSRIVYTRHPATKPDDLFVMNADGTGVKQLTTAKKPISAPMWTTDGSRIVFQTERDNNFDGVEIYAIAPDGTGETLLATDALSLSSDSTLSTAGDKIAYLDAAGEVRVMNLDGTGATTLASEAGASNENPQISPDATKVAFASKRGGSQSYRVYTVGVDDSSLTEVYGGGASLAGWSPDGTKLALSTGSKAASINADGSGFALSTPGNRGGEGAVGFSPDGTRIVSSQIQPKAGEDPFYRLFSNPVGSGRSRALTGINDGALYGDWQPLSAAPTGPDPELTLTAKARNTKRPQARVECSNECYVKLKAKGELGGVKFKSRTEAHLYGADWNYVDAIGAKSLKALKREHGKIDVLVRAVDDFGQVAKRTITVEVG